MSITACPNCGSKKIFQGRLKDGVLTGYSDKYVCRDCGYQGSPLIFDSLNEYQNFEIGKKSDKISETVETQLSDNETVLSEKEKEVVDFLNELDDSSTPEVKNKSTTLIMLFVVLIFSLIITLFYVPFEFYLPTILMVIVLFIVVYTIYYIKNRKI